MQLAKLKHILFILTAFFLVYFSLTFPFDYLNLFDSETVLTSSEFKQLLNKENIFNNDLVVSVASPENDEKMKEYIIKYKLFNLVNVKTLKVKVADDENIYAGGDALGFSLKSKGAIIVGGNYILTKTGKQNPFKESGLQIGDIIIKLNDYEINSTADISIFLEDYYKENDEIKVTIMRNNEIKDVSITPALDIQSNSYKLGIWIKDTTLGVGTLTFINDETCRFGALGHAVSVGDNNRGYEVENGEIYDCRIIGVKEGQNGKAGQLMGTFSPAQETHGSIDKNCEYGVFGTLNENSLIDYIEDKYPIEVGGRATVKPGKAQILSCIDGKNIKTYDIEIIKTNFQKSSNEKSMVIRVIDKELLSKTGGIVQGMSGSPIIQNGKLVGAVTHVFLNDASKGFGIYIDWMIDE